MAFLVTREQAHRSIAVPSLQRVCFVLAFAVRPLDLQDSVSRGNDMRDEVAGQRLFELEIPPLRALRNETRQAFVPGAV